MARFGRLCRRRRILTYVFIVIIVALIFMLFQMLSYKFINHGTKKTRNEHGNKIYAVKKKVKSAVLGVSSSDEALYKPDALGHFVCLDKSVSIQFSRVNDDFCDCLSDGSDEPATDACPNGRFYCETEEKYIPSSRVNDGICDCCDASDEWNEDISRAKVRGHPATRDFNTAPCIDTCGDLIKRQEQEAYIQKTGAKLKQQYIQAGINHQNGKYGEHGEFYRLSQTCFERKEGITQYTVCPFKSVSQYQNRHTFQLGEKPVMTKEGEETVLRMERGDKRNCPSGTTRTSLIYFSCGLSDQVLEIREDDVCIYKVKFMTPAAC
ncbi:uncharacterized protein [Amphiura filiformis]|uniref:uncharacterized protein n=1 Tax=Amphiura filiformis TaxID=82378 RepID=UPI003B221701